jgi:hypothetical protein
LESRVARHFKQCIEETWYWTVAVQGHELDWASGHQEVAKAAGMLLCTTDAGWQLDGGITVAS